MAEPRIIVVDKLVRAAAKGTSKDTTAVVVIRLRNETDAQFRLSGIKSGCNCVVLASAAPSTIDANSETSVTLSVTPPRFGFKRVKVAFTFDRQTSPAIAFIDAVSAQEFPVLRGKTNVSPTFFQRKQALEGQEMSVTFAEALDSKPYVSCFESRNTGIDISPLEFTEHAFPGFGYVERVYRTKVRLKASISSGEMYGDVFAKVNSSLDSVYLGRVSISTDP